MSLSTRLISLFASVSCLALASKAQAQDDDARPTDASGGREIEEILVTATKRSESLQDVPVAISAFSSRFIASTNLDDVKDLVKFTPGFSGDTRDSFIDFLNIRGISTNDFGVGGDPSVAIFKDNLYQGRNGVAVTSLFDLERAEVLRGPQGFLFGRNAIAGAISLHTAKPVIGAYEGFANLGVGERGIIEGEAAVNVPVAEQVALRVAGYYSHEDGYVDNLETPEDDELIGHEKYAFRISGRYEAERFDLTLRAEYEDRIQDGSIYRAITGPSRFNGLRDSFGPLAPSGGVPSNGLGGSIRDISADANLGIDDRGDIFALGLEANYDLGGAILTVFGNYRDHEYQYAEDFDGTRLALNDYSQDQSGDYIEGEVRLVSDTDSALSWYAGVSAYSEDIDALFTNRQGEEELCTYYYYSSCADYLGDPAFVPLAIGQSESNQVIGKYQGFAAYIDVNYAVTEKLEIGLGLRYSYDEKDFAINVLPVESALGPFFTFGVTTDGFIEGQNDYDDFTPRAVIRYRPNEDWTLYVSATRGYKAGGFGSFAVDLAGPDAVDDDGVALPGATPNSFDPETVWSFEYGAKGSLFDNRLQLDMVGYYYRYKDLQLVIFETGGSQVVNIGKAEGYGFEASANWYVSDHLDVFLAATAQESEVIEADGFCDDCVGNRLPQQPNFALSGQVRYHQPILSGEWEALVDWRAQTRTYGGLDNLQGSRNQGYGDFSFRIGYEDEDGWFIRAYVENVFDADYFDATIEGDALVPSTRVGPSRPRTFGVRFGARFGG